MAVTQHSTSASKIFLEYHKNKAYVMRTWLSLENLAKYRLKPCEQTSKFTSRKVGYIYDKDATSNATSLVLTKQVIRV
jgi:hypothetical protein